MDKILKTDVYISTERTTYFILSTFDGQTKRWLEETRLEKKSDMIVLTKEQYLENIKDAMNYMCTPREYLEHIENLLK